MPNEPTKRSRRSIRLREYDYTSSGAYFCTLCVRGRECVLGEVVNGEMTLSDVGRIVAESWRWLGEHHPYVTLDAWVVMPNYLHGIIVIEGGSRTAPTATTPVKRKPLGRLIGAFKTISTKHINESRGTPGETFWQRSFYDRIIRNQRELDAVREYIAGNPLHWHLDREHPDQRGIQR